MKKGQINTIFLILALIGGVINLYRYYSVQGGKKPDFEIFDVRTFNDLEPMTIVHYQIRNVGRSTAHEVLTSVSAIGGNETPPALFANLSIGKAVSVNRKISPGDYTQLRVGVICREFEKAKYYNVETDLGPEPPQRPDFIVYNLTLGSTSDDNQTSNRATFWIMNIGGLTAHNVDISLKDGSGTLIYVIPPGGSAKLSLDSGSLTWEGVVVEISCDEGVEQNYFLVEYR